MPPRGVLIPVALALLLGAWAGARGVRLLARGLRHSDDLDAPLWVIRGFRGVILALCATALSAGAVFEQRWLIVFGAIWLAEEVYETGVLALILRAGAKDTRREVGETTPASP